METLHQAQSNHKKVTQSAGTNGKALQDNRPLQRKPNHTGLPDNLKSGMESLSGMSLDHVRVHYNSSKPAAVQAHAYALGSNIHLAPGQEKHLPHELGHVVQQAQGRVKPTTSVNGVAVNDSPSLEKEADLMGWSALQFKTLRSGQNVNSQESSIILQRVEKKADEEELRNYLSSDKFKEKIKEHRQKIGPKKRKASDLNNEYNNCKTGLDEKIRTFSVVLLEAQEKRNLKLSRNELLGSTEFKNAVILKKQIESSLDFVEIAISIYSIEQESSEKVDRKDIKALLNEIVEGITNFGYMTDKIAQEVYIISGAEELKYIKIGKGHHGVASIKEDAKDFSAIRLVHIGIDQIVEEIQSRVINEKNHFLKLNSSSVDIIKFHSVISQQILNLRDVVQNIKMAENIQIRGWAKQEAHASKIGLLKSISEFLGNIVSVIGLYVGFSKGADAKQHVTFDTLGSSLDTGLSFLSDREPTSSEKERLRNIYENAISRIQNVIQDLIDIKNFVPMYHAKNNDDSTNSSPNLKGERMKIDEKESAEFDRRLKSGNIDEHIEKQKDANRKARVLLKLPEIK